MTWRCTQVKFLEWDPENPRTFEFEFSRSIQEAARSFFLNPRVLHQNNPKLTGKDKLLKYWYTEVVNFYIGRHITYKNDKLIAIYGVAKKLQESFKGVEYLAGIWADDIHRELAWETEGRKAVDTTFMWRPLGARPNLSIRSKILDPQQISIISISTDSSCSTISTRTISTNLWLGSSVQAILSSLRLQRLWSTGLCHSKVYGGMCVHVKCQRIFWTNELHQQGRTEYWKLPIRQISPSINLD
jgi:hypothetical protein